MRDDRILEAYRTKYPFLDFEQTDTGLQIICGNVGVGIENEAISLGNMETVIQAVLEKAAEVHAKENPNDR